jgi:hypothetical protein
VPSAIAQDDNITISPMHQEVNPRMFRKKLRSRNDDVRGSRGQRLRKRPQRFLGFMERYVGMVENPNTALAMALYSMNERYLSENNPAGAEGEMKSLLAKTKDPKKRNIILFSLRRLYEQTGDKKKFDEINRLILNENVNGG